MQRQTGNFLLVFGTVLFGISLLADFLRLGNGTFFGEKQIISSLAGLLIASVGIVIFRRSN